MTVYPEAGQIWPQIGRTYPFEEYEHAMNYVTGVRSHGKTVLTIVGDST